MYKTKEIAALAGVHPNTVRVYEKWGFISPVPRKVNGYRIYTDMHLFQLKIARILFQCEIVHGNIRAKARAIVYASGNEDFAKAEELTLDYLSHLQSEYGHALSAVKVVDKWLKKEPATGSQMYSRREIARILNVSTESVRNWERNGLVSVPRAIGGTRVYGERELERLRVIRSLRSAHFSLNAILRLLNQIEQPHPNVITILNTPLNGEDIVYVTDRLILALQEAITGAKAAAELLEQHTREYKGPPSLRTQ